MGTQAVAVIFLRGIQSGKGGIDLPDRAIRIGCCFRSKSFFRDLSCGSLADHPHIEECICPEFRRGIFVRNDLFVQFYRIFRIAFFVGAESFIINGRRSFFYCICFIFSSFCCLFCFHCERKQGQTQQASGKKKNLCRFPPFGKKEKAYEKDKCKSKGERRAFHIGFRHERFFFRHDFFQCPPQLRASAVDGGGADIFPAGLPGDGLQRIFLQGCIHRISLIIPEQSAAFQRDQSRIFRLTHTDGEHGDLFLFIFGKGFLIIPFQFAAVRDQNHRAVQPGRAVFDRIEC